MKIDFVINKEKHLTGLFCYSFNLKEELSKKIRLREVDTTKGIPKIVESIGKIFLKDIKEILRTNPLFLPLRKDAVVHLTTQNFVLPLLFHKYKNVVTVHDMFPFEYPRKDLHPENPPSFFNFILSKIKLFSLKKADRIITISEYTKKRVIEILDYPPEKIDVVYYGLDKTKFKPLKIKRDSFTVLYIGSEMPRKNLPVLIKAFAKVKKRLPQTKLIKVGSPQWPMSRKKLKELVSKLGLSDSVMFKCQNDNPSLEYCKASLFVQPSIYEGFGLPVIEAMACGCPVICSDKTSLPEVAGDAAIYFDGYNVDDLAKKMYKILTDKKLQGRLRKKGIERAKKFSWEKAAKETLEVYKKI